jgi:hypothetical protein
MEDIEKAYEEGEDSEVSYDQEEQNAEQPQL